MTSLLAPLKEKEKNFSLLKPNHEQPMSPLLAACLDNSIPEVSVIMRQAQSGYGPTSGWWRERAWMGSDQVMLKGLKQHKKTSKPSRDPPQSLCQKRMKSGCAKATRCSYFNLIQFASTAANTKWVIILQFVVFLFLKRGLCKLFSTVWSQCYINSVLWKHQRILDAKRMCERQRADHF